MDWDITKRPPEGAELKFIQLLDLRATFELPIPDSSIEKDTLNRIHKELDARRISTREQAFALRDDLNYLEEILNKKNINSEILRRAAIIIRRIIVDNGLIEVATCRIGRFKLCVKDIDNIKEDKYRKYILFCAFTYARVYAANGDEYAAGGRAILKSEAVNLINDILEIRQLKSIDMSFYRKYPVICMNGTWISRDEIIKHMANKAHVAHSGQISERVDILIHKMRHGFSITVDENGLSNNFDIDAIYNELPDSISRRSIDYGYLSLLTIIKEIIHSPDVHLLRAYLSDEYDVNGR